MFILAQYAASSAYVYHHPAMQHPGRQGARRVLQPPALPAIQIRNGTSHVVPSQELGSAAAGSIGSSKGLQMTAVSAHGEKISQKGSKILNSSTGIRDDSR
jgi:hypothetical protein